MLPFLKRKTHATPSQPSSDLQALNREISIDPGTVKAPFYFDEYERILAPIRNNEIRLLELGVHDATSMMIWQRYLPNAVVVGLDSNPKPSRFPDERRFRYVQGLQDDPAALKRAVDLAGGPFDLIIDDCAHIARIAKRSFAYLFTNHLKPCSYYVIEDIGTSFLPEHFDDGTAFVEPPVVDDQQDITLFPSHQNGLVGYAKQLVDHLQMDLATRTPKTLPVERITFRTNLVVIERSASPTSPSPWLAW